MISKHDLVHKISYIAHSLVYSKSYITSCYGHEHIDHAIEACNNLIDKLGQDLNNGEEKV